MIVLTQKNIKDVLNKNRAAIALGNFDGIHTGHREVIGAAVSYGKNNGMFSIVHMFDKNPLCVVKNDDGIKCLTNMEKRLEILEGLGVDGVYIENFSQELMHIEPENFIREHIINFFNAKYISVGYNYTFGYKKQGNTDLLKKICGKYCVELSVCPPVTFDAEVSSTYIRQLVVNDIEKAAVYLGRFYSLSGEVVHGAQLGREIGFATANIRIPEGMCIPGFGVYAVYAEFGGRRYAGVANVGRKPTVDAFDVGIETHFLDFSGDLYGKKIEIFFIKKIRETIKFNAIIQLKEQIEKDIINAQKNFVDIGGKMC